MNSPLDYETIDSYLLTIRATDIVSSSWSSTSVSLRIRDSNDIRPVFEKAVYDIVVTEEYMPLNGIVAKIRATDNDTGVNSLLQYQLVADAVTKKASDSSRIQHAVQTALTNQQQLGDEPVADASTKFSPGLEYFYMRPSDGMLTLRKPLDYEQFQQLHLSVIVRDSGLPSLSSTARINVQGKESAESALKTQDFVASRSGCCGETINYFAFQLPALMTVVPCSNRTSTRRGFLKMPQEVKWWPKLLLMTQTVTSSATQLSARAGIRKHFPFTVKLVCNKLLSISI